MYNQEVKKGERKNWNSFAFDAFTGDIYRTILVFYQRTYAGIKRYDKRPAGD